MIFAKSLSFSFILGACQSHQEGSNEQSGDTQLYGYENTRRAIGVNGLKKPGDSNLYFVTGRTSMADTARTQCEAAYAASQMIRVSYQDPTTGPKVENLYVAGVNNRDFGLSDNGKIPDSCGTVVEATFKKNNKEVIHRFVVIDRIHEDHAQNIPNLDIAKDPYNKIRAELNHSDNFTHVSVKTIAPGSYSYQDNPSCQFVSGSKTLCGNK